MAKFKELIFWILVLFAGTVYSQQSATLIQGTANYVTITTTKPSDNIGVILSHITPDSTQVDSVTVYAIISNKEIQLKGNDSYTGDTASILCVGSTPKAFVLPTLGATLFRVKYVNEETVYNRKTSIVISLVYSYVTNPNPLLTQDIRNLYEYCTFDRCNIDTVCSVADTLSRQLCLNDTSNGMGSLGITTWWSYVIASNDTIEVSTDITFPAYNTVPYYPSEGWVNPKKVYSTTSTNLYYRTKFTGGHTGVATVRKWGYGY